MAQQLERVPVMNAVERERNLTKIREWVDAFRQQYHVKDVGRKRLFELSCEAFGEGFNLLVHQLVNTEYPHGAWRELLTDETGDIIQLVLDEMPKHGVPV